MGDTFESGEQRVARYLEMAEEALKAASSARTRDVKEAYLRIANSWIELAEQAVESGSLRAPSP